MEKKELNDKKLIIRQFIENYMENKKYVLIKEIPDKPISIKGRRKINIKEKFKQALVFAFTVIVVASSTTFITKTINLIYDQNVYKEEIKLYDGIVENTAQMIKNLNITEPTQIFSFYIALLSNNYFSNTPFTYNTENNYDIDGSFGIEVMTGSGACRHTADLLTDIYKELGFEAYNMVNYVELENQNVLSKTLHNIYGNHSITIVNNNGTLYGYDTTNFMVYKIDGLKAKSLNTDHIAVIKPFMSLNTFYTSPGDTMSFLEDIAKNKQEIDKEETWNNILEGSIKYFMNSESVIETQSSIEHKILKIQDRFKK